MPHYVKVPSLPHRGFTQQVKEPLEARERLFSSKTQFTAIGQSCHTGHFSQRGKLNKPSTFHAFAEMCKILVKMPLGWHLNIVGTRF